MNIVYVYILSIICVIQSLVGMQEPKDTVFLTILARNKAHMLPYYLSCIDKLEYDKQLMTIYINTNNNVDATEEILREWAEKNKKEYKQIIFESHHVKELSEEILSHDWTPQKLKTLGAIRNKSLQIAKDSQLDYYFVVDCDNFIIPSTLKHLVLKRKPIIAPMLTDIPNIDSLSANFFGAVNEWGYSQDNQLYWSIFYHIIVGTIEVPLVHCTYLIDLKHVDKLTYDDGTGEYEFIVFSRSARQNDVSQYICNEKLFGTSYAVPSKLRSSWTLEQEKKSIDAYFAALEDSQYQYCKAAVLIPYIPLREKPIKKDYNSIKADVIIFAQSPKKLIELLDSLKMYVSGVDHIFVMYKAESLKEVRKYNIIRNLYPAVEFDIIDEQGSDFSDILLDVYLETQSEYILFIKGDVLFQKAVSLNQCINALEDTGAYAFYFKLNAGQTSQQLPFIEYKNNVCAWNFAAALDQWSSANSFDCVLHKKAQPLTYRLENYYGFDTNELEAEWANEGSLDRVGLCFNESHVATLH